MLPYILSCFYFFVTDFSACVSHNIVIVIHYQHCRHSDWAFLLPMSSAISRHVPTLKRFPVVLLSSHIMQFTTESICSHTNSSCSHVIKSHWLYYLQLHIFILQSSYFWLMTLSSSHKIKSHCWQNLQSHLWSSNCSHNLQSHESILKSHVILLPMLRSWTWVHSDTNNFCIPIM